MSRSSSLRALPVSELGTFDFRRCELAMPKAWLASHLPIDGCHHTGRLRRMASPRTFALPAASLHDRFGSYGQSTTFSSTAVILHGANVEVFLNDAPPSQ